jgi:hypothetical protein
MSMRKPDYIDPAVRAGSAALPATPPFVFREVTARVFPVKANPARLHSFVDRYLNMDIPSEISHFRPSIPYVYVMVLNYGKMAVESISAQNLGWVSQHEVVFTVPLTWWRKEQGRLVFKDWAFVSPFIFVDNALSQTTGREVYGWPKVAATVDAEHTLWTEHPRLGVRLFTLRTKVFPKTYAGQRESPRVLMQIDRDPIPSYSQVPMDPANPWSPWNSIPRMAGSTLDLMGDALDMFSSLRLRGYRRSPESMLSIFGTGSRNLARLVRDLLMPGRRQPGGEPTPERQQMHIEQITLKQFREPERPNQACYQALVASTMGFDCFNRGGLMGDINLLRGDPSGGFTLRLHRYPNHPIVESLGMEVARVEERDGAPVDVLKPALPFWSDVDLVYGAGRVICSRTPVPAPNAAAAWRDEQSDGAEDDRPTGTFPPYHIPYNTARGAATQPIAGPFRFPDVTLQVYPLLADPDRLDDLLDRYLNGPLASTGERFERAGSYVYLLLNHFGSQLGTMWSESNNIGWWADREVSFCVPVKWFQGGELRGLALVSPFVFANSGRAAITDREVNGRPTLRARIDSPPDQWLSDSGPVADRRLLRLQTLVFPALHLGQEAQERTLLELDGGDCLAAGDAAGWRLIGERWGESLVRELKRKGGIEREQQAEIRVAKTLAHQLLAQGSPVNWISLKQYRDAGATESACYQALVHTARSITAVHDLREIDERLHLRLHRYPGQPIAETFGLKVKHVSSTAGTVVQDLQPIRPFWMRVSMKEDLGRVLCWRSEDKDWTIANLRELGQANAACPDEAQTGLLGTGMLPVGTELCDAANRTGLKDQVDTWLHETLTTELAAIIDVVRSLPKDEQDALRRKVLADVAGDHSRLLDHGSAEDVAQRLETAELLRVVDLCRHHLGARVEALPHGPARLPREEARAALQGLDEVQVVVETILSEGWENGSASRSGANTGDTDPPIRVRADSVGSARAELEERHPELKQNRDGWWSVGADD